MSETTKLNIACSKLKQLIKNPYAVMRYLEKSTRAESQWESLAKSMHINYKSY